MEDLFKTIGGTLLRMGAGTLGTAIGGPLGGVIAGKAVDVLADALGVPAAPEAINDALQTDPDAAVKVQVAEHSDEWRAAYAQAAAQQAATINTTIQQENQGIIDGSISKWHWRHINGYIVPVVIVAILPPLVQKLWLANAGDFIQILGTFSTYFLGVLGLLGYVAMDTTRFKTGVASGQPAPTIIGAVVGAIAKKK